MTNEEYMVRLKALSDAIVAIDKSNATTVVEAATAIANLHRDTVEAASAAIDERAKARGDVR